MTTSNNNNNSASNSTTDTQDIVVVTPCEAVPVPESTKTADQEASSSTTKKIETPTDRDVLCGRGKGIRFHPGNLLFNKLLRDYYRDYTDAPKGSKADIVRKILETIRVGQSGGRGLFLDCKGDYYVDIGDERAMNKTAQAFRDIRVTEEKNREQEDSDEVDGNSSSHKRQKPNDDDTDEVKSKFVIRAPSLFSLSKKARRPTFQERLAMLQRQVDTNSDDEDSDGSCSSSRTKEEEEQQQQQQKPLDDNEDVSDTETEESFPVYNPDT
jgi:hypothetical protein